MTYGEPYYPFYPYMFSDYTTSSSTASSFSEYYYSVPGDWSPYTDESGNKVICFRMKEQDICELDDKEMVDLLGEFNIKDE